MVIAVLNIVIIDIQFYLMSLSPVQIVKKIWGLVRQRTIPTERSPLVGEVSANFSG
jgi:hypothetical protein